MSNSRRTFLRNSALASLAMSMPFRNQLMAMAPGTKPFGIQLWSIKEALNQNPVGMLKQLAADGYKEIESFEGGRGMFWGMKNTEFKKLMDDLGMQIVSSHCDHAKDFERKAAEAGEIGMKYLICPWVGPQKSLDNFKAFADEFNACGEIAKKHGLRFAYHNHDYSFKPMEGVVPQDLMIERTNPAIVDFEMDMYWTVAAGVSPIAYMKKYPNRFKLVHVKDMSRLANGEHESCIVGKGTIDYKSLLPQVSKLGVQRMIVEQEAYTGSNEMDAAKADAAYMKTLIW